MKVSSILTAGLLLIAAAASAQDRSAPNPEAVRYAWADVLRVDPVYDDSVPADQPATQQECYEEQVLQPAQASEPDSGRRAGATVLGAIFGGIIGSRFGKGDGRKAATAAGVVAGGVVGNNIAANNDARADAPKYTTQRRCRDVPAQGSRHVVAYDVEYRYRGDVYTSRMEKDPGDRLRVRVSVTPAE